MSNWMTAVECLLFLALVIATISSLIETRSARRAYDRMIVFLPVPPDQLAAVGGFYWALRAMREGHKVRMRKWEKDEWIRIDEGGAEFQEYRIATSCRDSGLTPMGLLATD